jgi:hypothetical protein
MKWKKHGFRRNKLLILMVHVCRSGIECLRWIVKQEGSLNLNDAEKRMQQELCDSSESDDDKELLEINVAGSAYSASSPNHNITNLRSTVLPVEDQGSLDEQPFDDEVLVKIKDKSSTYLASSSQTVVDLTTILDTAELGAQVTDDKTVADHKGSSSCSGLSLKQKVDVSLRAAILTVDDQESLCMHLSEYPTFLCRFNAIFVYYFLKELPIL